MGAHTEGPWRVVIDGTCSAAWPHIGPAGWLDEEIADDPIAALATSHVEKSRRGMPGSYSEKPQRFKPSDDHDEVMANARLIAAAPELLSTLEAVERRLARTDGFDGTKEIIRAAIALATGGHR